MALRGGDLLCYSNKIKAVGLQKCPHDHWLTKKAYLSHNTVANISKSFTHNVTVKTSWHRYKANWRHCHPVYWPCSHTIRDAILTCARKPTWVSFICRTEPTTKKCKNRKTKSRKQICSEITVNSLGNPCSESWKRKRKGCGGKDLQKRKVLSLE